MADSKTITELSDALNRGNVDGALEAVGLPRRAFLTGLAAMVPAATGTSTAAAALPSDDAKLVDCARRIAVLREKEKVTAAESARTYKIYEEIKPAKPRALLWRVGDPVDYLRGQAYQFKENGKTYLWCDHREIGALKKRRMQLPRPSWTRCQRFLRQCLSSSHPP